MPKETECLRCGHSKELHEHERGACLSDAIADRFISDCTCPGFLDEVTRAVDLTKAEILRLNAAFLRCMVAVRDAPTTFVELKALVQKTASEWEQESEEFRKSVSAPMN